MPTKSSHPTRSQARPHTAGETQSKPALQGDTVVLESVVSEGDVISFSPTGEQVRVTKIERGRITFEKHP